MSNLVQSFDAEYDKMSVPPVFWTTHSQLRAAAQTRLIDE
ncbi:hypothetical protein PC129_g9535 [Phytophthora cactorum]|uniref:Uncharacterized protein n=1 Tax=Phytophthora cactorum TaxID=29920 RepID=A0A329S7Z4_9STRA|nr:hypothetical protein Pcac1_g22966 [Phytophthora cactorum]KAG2823050.1 hypothetical protein PC112_g10675 [Phytophthora cactorum]KAG2825435.1 hypothetical protein PC111_g9400 [Phytophthora cactorum]KAG2855967.1 hypothetical protein PC113_g11971 [Phytophthora cactorum]KAG2902853.1 hypothetical protein PC114_g12525 [Phytophthora cactorum]